MYNLEHFERINDSLYLSKKGLEAAIINDAGTGILEIGVSGKIDRDLRHILPFSALGRIIQNQQTKLLFHDHFRYGSLAKYCYGGATHSYYHFNDAVPITEEHIKQYITLFQVNKPSDTPKTTPKVMQEQFTSLKELSLSLHKLAMIVAMDYVDRDTWAAKLPILGRNARLRRDSAELVTGIFDVGSNYFISWYETDFKKGTREMETYLLKEKQLQLFEPRVSI